MVPKFFSSSKIVGGDTKIVGQNITFQESHKTKPIPIVFAILKDFSHHFEGFLDILELWNFVSLFLLNSLMIKAWNPKIVLFDQFWWSAPLNPWTKDQILTIGVKVMVLVNIPANFHVSEVCSIDMGQYITHSIGSINNWVIVIIVWFNRAHIMALQDRREQRDNLDEYADYAFQ